MISVLSHADWLSLISFILKTLYASPLHHQSTSLGQILLIPGHYVAFSGTEIFFYGSLEDLYPYRTAQLGKKKYLSHLKE